jgi:hypothetical protein
MDLIKMIAELRSEREVIDNALIVLERLARTHGTKRRGRPPAWLSKQNSDPGKVAAKEPSQAKKRFVSPEVKQKMAAAQKKRWDAYRKTQGKS